MKNSIGIIGFGRFGRILANLLDDDFQINIYDPHIESATLEETLAASTLFIAVPIRNFETVIKNIADRLAPGTTVIDVCSDKI